MTHPVPELVTLDRAAEMIGGASRRMLRARIAEGSLAAVRVGRAYFVRAADVLALFAPVARPATSRARLTVDEAQRAAGLVPAAEAMAISSVGRVRA